MRLLAVGDIHGCLTALETLAAAVPFGDNDLLVTLGDYVDRGPNSREVLDWLIERDRAGRLVALRGNHDLAMLAARDSETEFRLWLPFGGDATIRSYAPDDPASVARSFDRSDLNAVPAEHWRFIQETCRDWYETETHFFVHASVDPHLPLNQQTAASLFWAKFLDPLPHVSGKIMVCGHTAQKNGLPRNVGHAVCIDTWVYGDGWLTCLEPATGRCWQANQRGESRVGTLATL